MVVRQLEQIRERLIPEGSFRAHVVTLAAGTGAAQLVPLLASPILTRLYSPSDFGVFAIYMAAVTIAVFVMTGRYELAITLPESDTEAVQVLALTVTMVLSLSLALEALIILLLEVLGLFPGIPGGKWLWHLVPLGIFLSGLYQALYYWMVRKKMFAGMAARRMLQFVVMVVCQLAFGAAGMGAAGLLWGYVIGQAAGYGFLAWQVWTESRQDVLKVSWEGMLGQARRYRAFLFYSVPATLCNTLADQLPNLMLNHYFGAAVVGFFDLPRRIMSAPMTLMANSLLAVFQERASRDFSLHGSCRDIYLKTLRMLILLGLLPFLTAFLFGPVLVPLVFGAQWKTAGEYLQYVSLVSYAMFVAGPLGYVLLIVEQQRVNLFWQAALLLASAGAILAGVWQNDPALSVKLFSASGAVLCVFYLALSYYYSVDRGGVGSRGKGASA